tara:strand:- start:1150 stop:1812 length:663 start_codon:yes stop_codon:yes gene_type:complete
MSEMKLIMESWREYEEASLLEQRILERRATWADVKKFMIAQDPKSWKNRFKKFGKSAGKAALAIGAAGLAATAAPAIMGALGIGAAGPKLAASLIEFMGDDPSAWTEEKVADFIESSASALGNLVGAKAIMGAVDKLTGKTPLDRLNISDSITDLIDKKHEEAFYSFMNSWFKQNPNGPNNNPDEVIPKRWGDKMFSRYLQDKTGVSIATGIKGIGAQVS